MNSIIFKDKGLERSLKDKFNFTVLTSDKLSQVKGVLVAEGTCQVFAIPWQGTSSAFSMNFPDFKFNTEDSSNNLWEQDLHHFFSIESLHIYQPTTDLTFLSNFKNLKELYVEGSRNTDWSFISQLTCLEFLYLCNCQFPDLSPIRDLYLNQANNYTSIKTATGFFKLFHKISHVALIECGIKDLSPLEGVNSVHELDLSYNQISNIAVISKISQLYYLTLRYNQIKDITIFEQMRRIPYYVNLRHNLIEDCSPICKAETNNLARLFLGENPISDFTPTFKLRLVAHDIPNYKYERSKVRRDDTDE